MDAEINALRSNVYSAMMQKNLEFLFADAFFSRMQHNLIVYLFVLALH